MAKQSCSPLGHDRKRRKRKRPNPHSPFRGTAPVTWGTLSFPHFPTATSLLVDKLYHLKSKMHLCEVLHFPVPCLVYPGPHSLSELPPFGSQGSLPLHCRLVPSLGNALFWLPFLRDYCLHLQFPTYNFTIRSGTMVMHMYKNHTLNFGLFPGYPSAEEYYCDTEQWPCVPVSMQSWGGTTGAPTALLTWWCLAA